MHISLSGTDTVVRSRIIGGRIIPACFTQLIYPILVLVTFDVFFEAEIHYLPIHFSEKFRKEKCCMPMLSN